MMWAAGPVVTGYYPSANWISTLDGSATSNTIPEIPNLILVFDISVLVFSIQYLFHI